MTQNEKRDFSFNLLTIFEEKYLTSYNKNLRVLSKEGSKFEYKRTSYQHDYHCYLYFILPYPAITIDYFQNLVKIS